MIKSIFKLILIIFLGAVVIFSYQTKGYVDIRWQGLSISMKMGTFVLLVFLSCWILFYIFSFIKYLGQLSKNLKMYWRNRHELEGQKMMEEAVGDLAAEQGDIALKKAKKASEVLNDSLIAKWLYLYAANAFKGVVDDKLINSIAHSKRMGMVAYRLRIERLLKQADYVAAKSEALIALEIYPSAPWLHLSLFNICIYLNDPFKAEETCRHLKKLSTIDVDSKLALCYLLQSRLESDLSKKIKLLQQAFDLDKTNAIIAIELTKAYVAEGRPKKAQAVVETTWKYTRHPELGDLYLESMAGLTSDEVLSCALKLLEISNTSIEGYVVLVKACMQLGFYQKARYYLEKAIQAFGGMSLTLFKLRVALTQKDGAEKLDYPNWIDAMFAKKQSSAWECASCGFESSSWEPKCNRCNNVGGVYWEGEHEHASHFFAIKGR